MDYHNDTTHITKSMLSTFMDSPRDYYEQYVTRLAVRKARLVELEQIARLYGSPNCWTGTTGYLAGIILELVYELRKEN